MKNNKSLFILALAALTFAACTPASKKPHYNIDSVASEQGTEVFQPNWDSIAAHYHFPQWFRDGKFGIFIHWGVYSVPAFSNEWYARNMYMKDSREYKHHIETYGPHTEFGYKDFIPMFKAERPKNSMPTNGRSSSVSPARSMSSPWPNITTDSPCTTAT